jgi:hypothetical protein
MPLLRWTVIELFCDHDRCISHNRYEGVETTLLDLIKNDGWKFYNNKCYCIKHKIQDTKDEGTN